MIFYGNKRVDNIYYGNIKLKRVFNSGSSIFRRLGNEVWKPTFEADEEEQFIPDEHHPVDPLFEEYYGFSIYLRVNAEPGDKVEFPQDGTWPVSIMGDVYPMVVYDYYGQDWQSHTGLWDDTYRLSKTQTIEYGTSITQMDIEVLNPGDSLLPVATWIGGIGSSSWSRSYHNGTWSNANELLTEVYIGDFTELLEIEGNAFKDNMNLKNIRLNRWLYRIAHNAFNGCQSLLVADLRNCEGLKTIERMSFANCTSLEKIILPRPEQISNSMLDGCSSLQKIILLAEEPPIMYNDVDGEVGLTRFVNVPDDVEICVNPASVKKYKEAPRWSYYKIRSYNEDDFKWNYVP